MVKKKVPEKGNMINYNKRRDIIFLNVQKNILIFVSVIKNYV